MAEPPRTDRPGPGTATRPPRPTSRDVAHAAGVSQATVSLVLGDKWRGRVSERTAGLVRNTARELGYRPNLAARNLRLGRTRTALLVVPALTHEFFARVYTGAASVAAEHSFGVVLYPSPEGVGPAKDPFASARAALDGVIASSIASEALAAIRGTDLPLVMLDSDPAGSGAAAHVNLDIADAMRQVTDHLLGLGHRRITHLASAVTSWTFTVRAETLAEAVRGVPGALVRTVPSALEVHAAREAAERALAALAPAHGPDLRQRRAGGRRREGRTETRAAGAGRRLRHRLRRPGSRDGGGAGADHGAPARRTGRRARDVGAPRHPGRTRAREHRAARLAGDPGFDRSPAGRLTPGRAGAPNRVGPGHRKNRATHFSASPDPADSSVSEGASVGVDAAPSASSRRAS